MNADEGTTPMAHTTPPACAGPDWANWLMMLRDDQRRRWLAGERVRAEAYLARFPELHRDREGMIDLIYCEYLLRRELGERPAVEEYAQRFPETAEALCRQFALEAALSSDGGDSIETPPDDLLESSGTDVRPGVEPTLPSGRAYAFLGPPAGPGELGRLGDYRVLDWLGTGGMGIVFRAEDLRLRKVVALKVLRPDRADAAHRARFLREARALAAVTHANVVPIYRVGEENGAPFLVMPLLTGESLQSRLDRGSPLPLADVLRIGAAVAEGLDAAHSSGIVHRDLKPSNVWLQSMVRPSSVVEDKKPSASLTTDHRPRTDYEVKLLDFGLARYQHGNDALTQTGDVLGTPAYMSPEQTRGAALDARSDLFSLGGMLYTMATGARPFTGENTLAVLSAVREHEPPAPRALRPDVPPALEALIVRLLAKDPAARPASAAAVAARLRSLADDARSARQALAPGLWRRTLALAGAVVGVLLLALGVYAVVQPAAPAPALPLTGFIDLFVARGPAEARAYLRLHDAGVLPLRAGSDLIRVEAKVNRPAYLYIAWLDTEGHAYFLDPWDEANERRPAHEAPRQEVYWPSATSATLLPRDPAGTISLILLARDEPLPPDVRDAAALFGKLAPQASRNRREAAWFENGLPVTTEPERLAINFGPERTRPLAAGAVPIDDPVLHTQALLRGQLGGRFAYNRAVCFSSE